VNVYAQACCQVFQVLIYMQVTGGWHYVTEHSNTLTFRATNIYWHKPLQVEGMSPGVA